MSEDICIVLNSLGRGGAERSILLLAEELFSRGLPVRIVSLFSIANEYPVPPVLRDRVVRLGAKNFLQAVALLLRHLLNRRPALVFSLMPQACAAATLLGRLLSIPTFVSERTSPRHFYGTSAKLWVALMPHLLGRRSIFISQFALRDGLPNGPVSRLIRRNARVLHNPVTVGSDYEAAGRSRNARQARLYSCLNEVDTLASRVVLVAVSRLVRGKGLVELIRAAEELLRRPGFSLKIYGEGPMRAEIEAEIANRGLSEVATLEGFRSDMDAVYESADVVVLASESEGFGRTGFEAYQSGCLVAGLRNNSFVSEVLEVAPAWRVVADLSRLREALVDLSVAVLPAGAPDIKSMRQALSVGRHADLFLEYVRWGQ